MTPQEPERLPAAQRHNEYIFCKKTLGMKPFEIVGFKGSNTKRRGARRQAAEERVSLIDRYGKPTPKPSDRGNYKGKSRLDGWNMNRLMRYLSLTAVSAMVTFFILGRESKALHWEEYHHLLEPHAKASQRCYSDGRNNQNERCTCPAPSLPLQISDKKWMAQHKRMINDAKNSPKKLDIVFLGDEIVERWNGTKTMGTETIPGIRRAFETHFTTRGGGILEGLALGSSNDTGPNLLWHIENGLIKNLNPRIWFISIGSNDLYEEKCTDRFVVANVLNVIKAIHEQKPDSYFIVHGILPRQDNPKYKTKFLKKKWTYAQAINTQIRKFTEESRRLYFMQAGPLFLKDTLGGTGKQQAYDGLGRREVNEALLEGGTYPTLAGLNLWGDYIVKKVQQIYQDIEEDRTKGVESTGRKLDLEEADGDSQV